jgi:hypothetical protein
MTRPRRAVAVVPLALAAVLVASGCSTLEDSARDVGRSAVDAGRDAAAREAEELFGGSADAALGTALDQLPGTCADWAASPVVARTAAAELVARAVLLRSGETGSPTTEQVSATSSAVDERCADAGEGAAVRDVALDAAADAGLPVQEALEATPTEDAEG